MSEQKKYVVHCRHDPYHVLIDRTTKWDNPFKMGHVGRDGHVWTREEVITLYRGWLEHNAPHLIEAAKQELRGKVLGCWCAPLPCHGDMLAEIANA